MRGKLQTHTFKITVPIYRTAVMFIVGESEIACEDELQEQWEYNNPMDPHVHANHQGKSYLGRASVVESDVKGTIAMRYIFLNLGGIIEEFGYSDISQEANFTIAHECIHAAYFILDDMGIRVKASNHEALTYLVSYLHRECAKCLSEVLQDRDWKRHIITAIRNNNNKAKEQ